jgi:hypothetical protein
MPLSLTWDKKVAKALFGKKTTVTTFDVPTTIYVALGTSATAPHQNRGAGAPYWNFTEVTGAGYARVAVTNNTTLWVATTAEPTTGYIIVNNTAITFGAPTASWGTVKYFAAMTHSTGMTATYLILYGTLTVMKAVGPGDTTPSFASKNLKVKLS